MDRTQRIFTLAAFALVPIAGVLVANCTNDFGKFNVVAGTGGTVTTSSTTTSSTATGGAGGQAGAGTGGATGGAGGVPNGGAGGVPNGGAGGVPNGGAGGSGGSPANCGDDVLDPGEGCDDSDVTPGNGCSATCTIEGQSNCATPTAIALDPPGIWIGDTTANHQNITNTTCGGTSARDVVYAITPTQSATVNIDLTGGYNKIMAIRAACNSGGAEAFCQASLNALNTTFAATANTTFYVIVSGVTGAQGAFVLHVYY